MAHDSSVSSAQQQRQHRGIKRPADKPLRQEGSQKKVKTLLAEDDISEDGEESANGCRGYRRSENIIDRPENGFTINQDFARRFEHNKQREERQRRES